ncbi:MAG: sulfotransferase [Sphingomonas sp.]|nr:sulfotransferase [Sphingomonas sp.]
MISQSSRDKIVRPIFIVSTPRSGSTLLFETMVAAPDLFSTGRESHGRIERVADFHPGKRGWSSNRLTADDASDAAVETMAQLFYEGLADRDGKLAAGPVRMLEKTPKNALRVPFFAAAWPDSIFVYLYRDPRQSLSSMIEAWASGRFRTYPMLPGWSGYPWSLLLVPGWRQMIGKPLPEVVAHQWAITTNLMLADLEALPAERVRTIWQDDLLANPQVAVEKLARSLDLDWDRQLGLKLPLSKTTVSRPDPEKWRQLAHLIEPVMPIVESADARARAFLERF